jgi:hypothetical protein
MLGLLGGGIGRDDGRGGRMVVEMVMRRGPVLVVEVGL